MLGEEESVRTELGNTFRNGKDRININIALIWYSLSYNELNFKKPQKSQIQ